MGIKCQAKKQHLWLLFLWSSHISKTFHRLGEFFNRLFRVSMLQSIPDTVLNMTFQNYFSTSVKGRFCGIDLGKDILARHILIHHAVNGLHLAYNFL